MVTSIPLGENDKKLAHWSPSDEAPHAAWQIQHFFCRVKANKTISAVFHVMEKKKFKKSVLAKIHAITLQQDIF